MILFAETMMQHFKWDDKGCENKKKNPLSYNLFDYKVIYIWNSSRSVLHCRLSKYETSVGLFFSYFPFKVQGKGPMKLWELKYLKYFTKNPELSMIIVCFQWQYVRHVETCCETPSIMFWCANGHARAHALHTWQKVPQTRTYRSHFYLWLFCVMQWLHQCDVCFCCHGNRRLALTDHIRYSVIDA